MTTTKKLLTKNAPKIKKTNIYIKFVSSFSANYKMQNVLSNTNKEKTNINLYFTCVIKKDSIKFKLNLFCYRTRHSVVFWVQKLKIFIHSYS